METLAFILSPIIAVMEYLFGSYIGLGLPVGVAILLLSATFALTLWPVHHYSKDIEQGVSAKMEAVDKDVAQIDPGLKGEARFNEIERVYQQHSYHPISSVLLGINFLIAIPFLLTAIVVMTRSSELVNQSFLFIRDLSKPDQTLSLAGLPINIMPVIMLILTVFDAKIRYASADAARNRFYIIAAVLFVLVYQLPAGLILYWIGANLVSFAFYLLKR